MNSEHAALQLRIEDSRKCKTNGEKELSTPNPHVDGGKGKKAIVYNTKEEKRKGGGKKKKREEEKEKEKTKRGVYSQVIALEHVRGYFLYRYTHITLSF